MKEQLPAPDFNSRLYERPNQNWVCGHDAEGCACRLGPDARGRCRAAAYVCACAALPGASWAATPPFRESGSPSPADGPH